jgi:hypothetical protein
MKHRPPLSSHSFVLLRVLRGKRFYFRLSTALFAGAVLALTLFLAPALHAQSCALCYSQAANSGSKIIQGLRSGILILIIPPLFMSIGFTVIAYRKRNQFHRTRPTRSYPQSDW